MRNSIRVKPKPEPEPETKNKQHGIKKHLNKIIQGDALKVLKQFPEESIDCVITSPPYWQLRDYRWQG